MGGRGEGGGAYSLGLEILTNALSPLTLFSTAAIEIEMSFHDYIYMQLPKLQRKTFSRFYFHDSV